MVRYNRAFRWWLCAIGVVVALTLGIDVRFAQAADNTETHELQVQLPEQELAARYSPVAYVKQQRHPCDRNGEAFLPAPVEVVLGDPTVALVRYDSDDADVGQRQMMGPQARDLPPMTVDDHLDFPGNARRPGCNYERLFQTRMRDHVPTTYAHIVSDPEREQLALQYWFFYYFNDWNNAHEGDWEMIQLVFDVTSVEEALIQEPVLVGYAQHAGGEVAEWDDAKLEREGTHPIIYPAAGSHATYFAPQVYLGWGENGTGFGCDNASGPSVRVPLTPVVVPDDPDPAGSFAWLLFDGRWGERQPWEFNGARGPQSNAKWRDPFEAMETWRDASLVVPRSPLFGRSATGLFCDVTDIGARIFALDGRYPQGVAAGFVGLSVGFVLLLARVRGLIVEIVELYRAHWRVFLTIGVLTIPIGWGFNGLLFLLIKVWPLEWLVQWFNDTAGARLVVVAIVGGFEQLALVFIVGPAVIQTVADIRAGRSPDVRRSYQIALAHVWSIASALTLLTVVVGSLAFFVLTMPLAILIAVRWQFFGQAILLDGAPGGRTALRMSGRAMRGRWLTILGASFVIQGLVVLPGPVIGAVLMVMGKTTVNFANGLSSFVYAALLPPAVIALTLLYLQHADREEAARIAAEPGPMSRRRCRVVDQRIESVEQ